MTKLFENPALIVGLIRAVMIFAVSFGVGISQVQQDSTLELVGALLAVLSLILTGVTLTVTTPSAHPTIEQGTIIKVVTPEGQDNFSVKA